MYLRRLFSEVTGMETIGVILLLVFVVSSLWLMRKLDKNFRQKTSALKFLVGSVIFFAVSFLLSDSLIGLLLFSNGDYVNFGALNNLGLLLLSVAIGISLGFVLTKKVYFKFAVTRH